MKKKKKQREKKRVDVVHQATIRIIITGVCIIYTRQCDVDRTGRRDAKKYPPERKACMRLNRSGSPQIDYISRRLPDKRRGSANESVRGRWRGGTGEKPKTYLTLDGLLAGKTGGFFPFSFFLFRSLPERKWTRQMASAGRNFCAQRSNFRSPSPWPFPPPSHPVSPPRPQRHIHLGPFNVGNGHTGIQIPKLLWNLQRNAPNERMKRVCQLNKKEKKK